MGTIGHGNWLPWLKDEFGWSQSIADRFMNVADKFKCATVAHLDIAPKALYLLAQNSTSEEVRETAINMAEAGHTISGKAAEELKAKDKEIEQLKGELNKHKAPDIDYLIPELKEMLRSGDITPAVARNYSQLPEDGQKVQTLVENSRIRALNNLKRLESEKSELEKSVTDKAHALADDLKKNLRSEIEQARKEVAQSKIDIKKQLEESIRAEVEKKYQKELDKAEKAQQKAEKEAIQAKESMAAAHKESRELENENRKLKKQVEVSNPTQVDNKWASFFNDQNKHLNDYIELMKNEMDWAGGYPGNCIQALSDLMKSINNQLDVIEGNAIIEIKKEA